MKRWKRIIVGVSLLLYGLELLVSVAIGLYYDARNLMVFLTDPLAQYYANQHWYIIIGTYTTQVLMAVAGWRCISVCIRMKTGRYIVISGLIRALARVIPIITYGIGSGVFQMNLVPFMVEAYVIALGIWCGYGEEYSNLLPWSKDQV